MISYFSGLLVQISKALEFKLILQVNTLDDFPKILKNSHSTLPRMATIQLLAIKLLSHRPSPFRRAL